MQLQDLMTLIQAQGENSSAILGRRLDVYLHAGGTIYTQYQGKTLLSLAAELNQTDLVKELVEKGGYSQVALSQAEISFELISTPLKHALTHNNPEIVENILKITPVEFFDDQIKNEYIALAQSLGGRQAIIDLVKKYENIAKHRTVFPSSWVLLEEPLVSIIDVENAMKTNDPQHFYKILSMYLEHKGSIQAFSHEMSGFTILTRLVTYGNSHKALLNILLSQMTVPQVEAIDGNGKTALEIALRIEETDLVNLLLDKIRSIKKAPPPIMASLPAVSLPSTVTLENIQKAIEGNHPALERMIETYLNKNNEKIFDEFSSGNAKGRNILTLIIAHENIRILKYLLTKLEPESLEKKDGTEMKPLGLAAYLGKEDMVKLLMDKRSSEPTFKQSPSPQGSKFKP